MTLCESRPKTHLGLMLPLTVVSIGTNLLEQNSNMDALHQRGNVAHGLKSVPTAGVKSKHVL